MRVKGLPRGFYHVSRHPPPDLSPEAKERLRYLRCWEALRGKGCGSQEASLALETSRSSLYRWQKRLREQGPVGLEAKSRRPKRRRQPTWSWGLSQAVLELRQEYPRWGKDTLVVLLRRGGWQVSTSMVGRILRRLKARGVLKEPPSNGIRARRHPYPRPYAIRKPKDYQVYKPGDLVQMDTMDIRPLPGMILKHFTARDVISRWDVLEVHSRATAITAAGFLDSLKKRMPFPIKAIQVDGGSEFHASFEQACKERGFHLFVLPPRSPKLNGCVERANRTHREQFYELYDGDLSLPSLNQALKAWEKLYNTFRPHQALDGRTPAEYLKQCHPEIASNVQLSHM